MKNTITIIILSLIIGIIGGVFIHKTFSPKSTTTTTRFMEKLKIKELHLVKHIYQDLAFIHRKNDPEKNLKAVATVPVSLNSFIDLSKIKPIYKGDTINQIIIPLPEITEPNYQIDKMEIKKVKSFQVHIGKDLYSEVLKYMKSLVSERKKAIVKLAIENNIAEETKTGALDYINSLLLAFNMDNVKVSFAKASDNDENTKALLPENFAFKLYAKELPYMYHPEQFGAENVE